MSTAYDEIKTRLQGSMVALVTPMHPDGKVDYKRLADLIDWQIEQGTHCLVAVGTTGESATLSMQEHSEVIRYFVQHVKGRVPVIAGTGANNTTEAIKLTQDAADAGADCALLVAPYYNKPPQEGLYQHYKTIAEAVDIPQMLYNVPGRTVVDIAQETVERLADIDNIVAIKDATGSVGRGEQLIKAVGDRLVVLSGDDGTALELMKVGGKGNISVTANVAPKAMSETFTAALRGDFDTANKAHDVIKHLHRDLFIESSPIPVKYALYKMGMIDNGIRLPLVWLAEQHHATIDEALVRANLL
ncbi:4-hydroxy-tetrahydrodipicolinate synthase [Psychrobacter sp. AOP22-C1-22]|uniref:4-hydroxy-tetrahydrodipicolinate synthase n=1 Tax=unclassified Psychrobacter TaxID=196806 RepID=UPI0017886BF9|nr:MULTISPECIES: 4-hydroxy-tetrahydrodipicolinate synthase [unclassified Psychrobacter]MDN5802315.1 4-hydroxy-tetrahydrodipicolinate synthase [Psychrobacter sp.]MBE0405636.1 4-hydroxy-tetrahydrodipicolinate synthase [Psychrobacter sp. FME6]MBE0445987.1 4-hydroxy-tetrahydrodipicolinate synthase [Psychrobacter sp. FME5]MDN5890754.1 4-hydroxy-tetrahydrodipicolinate synthase [Psychrobacter sp.]MDN5897611.1 4-hydroxy-tetrahydrodipicolinate synthase [Psychrobacter sp.]